MADWLAAGVGLIGSIFGGGPSTPGYVRENYELQNAAFRKAMELYDSINFEQLDQRALTTYSDAAMKYAQTILGNYDAKAAAAGSPIWKSDTQKSRSRNQIAADAALPIAQYAAQQLSTRPQRQASILPNPAQAAAGFQSAAYLDQASAAQHSQEMGGLFDAAKALSKLYTDWKWSGSKNNDLYGYEGTGDNNYSWTGK